MVPPVADEGGVLDRQRELCQTDGVGEARVGSLPCWRAGLPGGGAGLWADAPPDRLSTGGDAGGVSYSGHTVPHLWGRPVACGRRLVLLDGAGQFIRGWLGKPVRAGV